MMDKREQIKNYFSKPLIEPISSAPLVLVGGIIAILMGFFALKSGGIVMILISFILFAWYFAAMKKESNRPKESLIDSWLEEDIQEVIKNRPFDKLGITKNDLVAESLLVVGPIYWNTSGFDVKDILMKKGKDGFNRYSIWTIQVFCFTENYLCSYKCHYNWIKNTYINESTNEFFYKDVVSVKTDTISSAYTLMNGQHLVHSEAFQLKLAGDEITVITNDVSLNTSTAMTSKAEKAVQSIRTMLRDKKK